MSKVDPSVVELCGGLAVDVFLFDDHFFSSVTIKVALITIAMCYCIELSHLFNTVLLRFDYCCAFFLNQVHW